MAKKSKEFIGLEITSTHLKLVHVKSAGLRREVTDLLAQEIREMSDDDLSAFIRRTATDWSSLAAPVFLSVPMHAVITRSIEIPSKDPEEIKEIVNLQASRHTPYSRSEIIIDTLNLGIVRESYTKVLLVIAPRELVARQTKIIEKAGLMLHRVFFAPEGMAYACAKILNTEHSDAPIVVVHMDSSFTSFQVIQRNKLIFVRGISAGAEQLLNEKELYAEKFLDELSKSVESYTADEAGPALSQAVLTGILGELNELDDLFREALHIPIRHQPYFNYFTISPGARAVATSSKMISFFNIIASLLLFDRVKIDLITEERKLQIDLARRAKEMVKMGVFTLVFLALLFVGFSAKIYFKNSYLQTLMDRYSPVKNEAKGLERIFSKTQLIKDYLSGRGESLETLTELYDALPNDVRVSNVRYDEGERFSVKGTSKSMSSVFAFVTNLEKSDKFTGVKTKYVTARSEDGTDVQDFEVAMQIERKGR